MENNDSQHETVTPKSIFKHGAIAITAIIVCIILIVLGIYLYGPTHKSNVIETNTKNPMNAVSPSS